MAIKWVSMGKTVTFDGSTVYYEAENLPISIESRKRKIPHANGRSGFWWYTSYFVLHDGTEVAEKYSLRDVKEYAETLL